MISEMFSHNNNTTLTVENEDFKVTIVDNLHTDLDVGNYCTLFRTACVGCLDNCEYCEYSQF